MPIVRTLLFQAARRLAADPQVRAKAAEVSRDHVLPAARKAAQKAGDVTRSTRAGLQEDIQSTRSEINDETTRAEFAGRVARKMMNRLRDDQR